jgi:hypothetical protein
VQVTNLEYLEQRQRYASTLRDDANQRGYEAAAVCYQNWLVRLAQLRVMLVLAEKMGGDGWR